MKLEGPDSYIPVDETPDSSVIPGGTYNLKIVDLEATYSREKRLRMVQLHLEITQGDYAGARLNISPFVLGTEDDPDAVDPDIWRRPQAYGAYGRIRWANLLKAVDLKAGDHFFTTCHKLQGRHFTAIVTMNKDEDPTSRYYLSERNNIPDTGYFKLGQAPGLRQAVSQPFAGGPPAPRERSGSPMPPARPRPQAVREAEPEPETVGVSDSDDDIPF